MWYCYLIMSLDSNRTYIGSSNNPEKRLKCHNRNDPSVRRTGAKYTAGQTWTPILIISGFHHKNACLSFEAGWKRLSKKRKNNRFQIINCMSDNQFSYNKNTKWCRIMDLLYFVHNITLLDTKYKLNAEVNYPIFVAPLKIDIMLEDWIQDLPWPYWITY